MNRRLTLISAAALGALMFAAPGLAGSTYKNHLAGESAQEANCTEGDVVTLNGDDKLWPPNH